MSAVITGMESVLKGLRSAEKDFDKKVTLPAVRKGLEPIRKQAIANCKWDSLRQLISKKAFINKRSRKVMGKVFLKPAKGRTIKLEGRDVGFEAVGMILEFGRKSGDLKPRPFMRPARDQAGSKAEAAIAKEISKRIKQL